MPLWWSGRGAAARELSTWRGERRLPPRPCTAPTRITVCDSIVLPLPTSVKFWSFALQCSAFRTTLSPLAHSLRLPYLKCSSSWE